MNYMEKIKNAGKDKMKSEVKRRLLRNYLNIKYSVFSLFMKKGKPLYKDERFNYLSYLWLKHKYKNRICTSYKPCSDRRKTIWWCWLQGEENAPSICKAGLKSLKRSFLDYDVTIITEDNFHDYVNFPDFIEEKYAKGIISRTHLSDLLRLELLIRYGGVWADSTVYCTGNNYQIIDKDFFMFQNWKFGGNMSMVSSNWFIVSNKSEPLLMAVRDLLYDYWKTHKVLINYFIFHLFFKIVTEAYPERWEKVSRISNIPPHLMQFELGKEFDKSRFEELAQMSDFHKLRYFADDSKLLMGNTFYSHLVNEADVKS